MHDYPCSHWRINQHFKGKKLLASSLRCTLICNVWRYWLIFHSPAYFCTHITHKKATFGLNLKAKMFTTKQIIVMSDVFSLQNRPISEARNAIHERAHEARGEKNPPVVAMKLFGTSHSIGWENETQTMVLIDPNPKTTELRANKIQWNYRFWRAAWQQL